MDENLLDEVDIASEQRDWTRILDALEVLDSYYEEITRAGGVSREQAQSLVQECGVAMGERYPPQSFTEIASRTNLTVAMEGMVDRSCQLIFELLKKAADLFMRVVEWVLQLMRQRRERQRQMMDRTRSIASVGQANQDLKLAGIDLSSLNEDQKLEVETSADAVENAADVYETNFNDLTAEILQSGTFPRLVRSLAFTAFEYAPLIRDKLTLFDKILRHPVRLGDASGNMIQMSELRTIATPIPASNVLSIISQYRFDDGQRSLIREHANKDDKETLLSAMQALFDKYKELRMGKEYDPVEIDLVSNYLADNEKSVIVPFILAPQEVIRTLDEIHHELERIRQYQASLHLAPENHEAFRTAVMVLTDEVSALKTFGIVALGCSDCQDRLVDDVWRYSMAVFQLNRSIAGASRNPSLIEKVNHVQAQLRTMLRVVPPRS